MEKVDIKKILEDFASSLPEVREKAVADVLERREEAVPGLLEILEKVLAVPEGAAVMLADWAWFLAAYLLAQFREKRALPLLLRQFTLPPAHVERLFRDILSEDLPRLLATLCEDDPAPLRELAENRSAHESVRASALWGYTILASLGTVPAEEAHDYLEELFQGRLERRPSHVWTSLVAAAAALHAKDLKPEILKAYHEELADPGAYSLREILKEWGRTAEESRKSLAEESGGLIRDVWDEMEYWPWVEGEDEGAYEE